MGNAVHLYSTSPFGPLGIGAFFYALFGGIFLALWLKDREPGLQWYGLGMFLACLFYIGVVAGLVRSPTAILGPPLAGSVLLLGIGMRLVGVAMFVDAERWKRDPFLYIGLACVAAGLLIFATGMQVPREWGNLLYQLPLAATAVIAWRARKTEPGAGYELLAAAAMLMPLSLAFMVVAGVDVVLLRYVAITTNQIVSLSLLYVCLHRRSLRLKAEVARRAVVERELEAANSLLEARVQARTAELQNLVTGLESFNRNVSHDLRGPLWSIQSFIRSASAAFKAGDVALADDMLLLIDEQTRRSSDLLSALLQLARIGRDESRCEHLRMTDLVRDVLGELQARQVITLPPVAVWELPDAHADPDLVRVVWTNLLSNACKFSADCPNPRVEVGHALHEGRPVFFVRDNGVGFDMHAAPQLYEPFRRLHDNKFAGHGVGLSIVKKAVERQGGKVWAEAAPGQGACFYFTLAGTLSPRHTVLRMSEDNTAAFAD